MARKTIEEKRWGEDEISLVRSEKKMEKDEGLMTMECLRGRLLAERQASNSAKEDAELMGNE
ncbi:hypothetical protein CCACVL1_05618, partial [Corchorus capsularis]